MQLFIERNGFELHNLSWMQNYYLTVLLHYCHLSYTELIKKYAGQMQFKIVSFWGHLNLSRCQYRVPIPNLIIGVEIKFKN